VTGHDDWEWIVSQGIADRPGSARPAKVRGNQAVCTHTTTRNCMLEAQYGLLERWALIKARNVKAKVNGLTFEKSTEVRTQRVNHLTCAGFCVDVLF
jgi:hypothetical protein